MIGITFLRKNRILFKNLFLIIKLYTFIINKKTDIIKSRGALKLYMKFTRVFLLELYNDYKCIYLYFDKYDLLRALNMKYKSNITNKIQHKHPNSNLHTKFKYDNTLNALLTSITYNI